MQFEGVSIEWFKILKVAFLLSNLFMHDLEAVNDGR